MSHQHSEEAHVTEYGASHGTTKSYIIGFIISIILTIIPFYFVITHAVSNDVIIVTIIATAILQLLVQLIFFLHMNTESKPRWNLTAFIFTLFVVAVLVVGSIWIMWNLNYNMMS